MQYELLKFNYISTTVFRFTVLPCKLHQQAYKVTVMKQDWMSTVSWVTLTEVQDKHMTGCHELGEKTFLQQT